jgi:hypothetical protein
VPEVNGSMPARIAGPVARAWIAGPIIDTTATDLPGQSAMGLSPGRIVPLGPVGNVRSIAEM